MTAIATDPVLEAAQRAYRAGLTVVPVREDGSKAPDVTGWAQYQTGTQRPTPEQMRDWFASGARQGVGPGSQERAEEAVWHRAREPSKQRAG